MTKESGPREKALREMREAKAAREEFRRKADRDMLASIRKLRGDVTEAAKKRGRPRKAKK